MQYGKAPALPAGAGGGPMLLPPPVSLPREIKVEVSSDLADIGRQICHHQAEVGAGESLRIRLMNNGTWIGAITISRDIDSHDSDGLTYDCVGAIFAGDRSIALNFAGEPDGPIGLPIRTYDVDGALIGYYTDDDADEFGDHTRAAFYAGGSCWTRENAPKVKPPRMNATERAGAKLRERANEADSNWRVKGRQANQNLWKTLVERARKGEFGTGKEAQAGMAAAWKAAKAANGLGEVQSSEESWPRQMPKPERRTTSATTRGAKRTANASNQSKVVTRGVHKRAPKAASVSS